MAGGALRKRGVSALRKRTCPRCDRSLQVARQNATFVREREHALAAAKPDRRRRLEAPGSISATSLETLALVARARRGSEEKPPDMEASHPGSAHKTARFAGQGSAASG